MMNSVIYCASLLISKFIYIYIYNFLSKIAFCSIEHWR
jgi:hypothetical protein